MRRRWFLSAFAAVLLTQAGEAQRHSFGSSPPTAPPIKVPTPVVPISASSSGMGSIQFSAVNYGVPPPQALTRQLQAEDERTRLSALSAIGAPNQYLQKGHVTEARSITLQLAQLGDHEELDAIVTAELDNHIVTAILAQDDNGWRRLATLTYATSFEDPRTTPSTFVHLGRSLLQRDRYRAIFRATTTQPNGDYVENEAILRIVNNRAIITMSFADAARECTIENGGKQPVITGCNVTQRWLQGDPADASHRFLLVTASGHLSQRDSTSPLSESRNYQFAHLRNFSCQPFVYSETTLRFEPVGPSKGCSR